MSKPSEQQSRSRCQSVPCSQWQGTQGAGGVTFGKQHRAPEPRRAEAQSSSPLPVNTRSPESRRAKAESLPYPHTDARIPTIIASISRKEPSLQISSTILAVSAQKRGLVNFADHDRYFVSRARITGASSNMNTKPCLRRACPVARRRKRSVSGCHDNLRQPVAPRRQGPWVPSPSRTRVFGPPPLIALPTLVREYLFSVTSGS